MQLSHMGTVESKVEMCQVSAETETTISGSAVVATRAEREREADPDASRPCAGSSDAVRDFSSPPVRQKKPGFMVS